MHLVETAKSLGQLALGASPWVPTSGPIRSGDITAEWLTKNLGKGAVCLKAEALDGTTGTTDRRRLGITWDEAGIKAGLPASAYIKSTPLTAKNRTMVASLDMSVNEVNFYHQIRPDLGDGAPHAHFTYSGNGARHLLVLEDLVALGAEPFALGSRCTLEHAQGVIDALANLHAKYWESPRLNADLKWVRPWSTRPGHQVLAQFYRRGRKKVQRIEGLEIPPELKKFFDAMDQHSDVVYRAFEEGPLTLLHGDSHLGNTYAMPDGRAGLLDWQVIWQGPGLREITYFMVSGLDADVRRPHERELIDRYLERLKEYGVKDVLSSDEAFQKYRLFAAEVLDAGAMTKAWPGLQSEENINGAWPRGLAAAEDLDVAGALKDAARR